MQLYRTRPIKIAAGVMPAPQAKGEAVEPAGRGDLDIPPGPLPLRSTVTPLTLAAQCIPAPTGPEYPTLTSPTAPAPTAVERDTRDDHATFDLTSGPGGRFDDCRPIQLETRGVISHRRRPVARPEPEGKPLEIWSSQTIHKNSVAAKLRSVGMMKIADELEECHSHYTVAQCQDCGKANKFPNRCDRFYCPECQPRLSRERRESVEWWAKEVRQPKHVVLTVSNSPDLERGHVQQLKRWLARLRRRSFCRCRTYWREHNASGQRIPINAWEPPTGTTHTVVSHPWRGGFYSLEVTNEGRGWHLHIHLLVDSDYIDARALSAEWDDVTGGCGYIVRVRDCRSTEYLAEVTKYTVKGSQLAEWSGEDIAAFISAFSGVRTFGVFGSLFGLRSSFAEWLATLREQKPLCECGSCRISYYTEAEWRAKTEIAEQPALTRPPPPPRQYELELQDHRQLAIY